MTREDYLNNLEIYSVDKPDYESYVYRLQYRDLLQEEIDNVVMFRDMTAGQYVCGYKDTTMISSNSVCREYFIFELLPEDYLGPEKVIKRITLSKEDYEAWIKLCQQVINKKDDDNGEESISTSR